MHKPISCTMAHSMLPCRPFSTHLKQALFPLSTQPLLTAMQRPQATVQAAVGLSEDGRGSVTPPFLQWSPGSWQDPLNVMLEVANEAWLSPAAGQFYLTLSLQSADPAFDGRKPRLRVSMLAHATSIMSEPWLAWTIGAVKGARPKLVATVDAL